MEYYSAINTEQDGWISKCIMLLNSQTMKATHYRIRLHDTPEKAKLEEHRVDP